MLAQIKRFAGDSLIYALLSVGTKIIALIMIGFYTNVLTGDELGALGVIDTTLGMLSFLILFGTDSALSYYTWKQKSKIRNLHMYEM